MTAIRGQVWWTRVSRLNTGRRRRCTQNKSCGRCPGGGVVRREHNGSGQWGRWQLGRKIDRAQEDGMRAAWESGVREKAA
eukprot:1207358-Prymnesium_polylepis.1